MDMGCQFDQTEGKHVSKTIGCYGLADGIWKQIWDEHGRIEANL